MAKKIIQKNATFDKIEDAMVIVNALIARADVSSFSFGGNFTREENADVIRFNVNWEEEETF